MGRWLRFSFLGCALAALPPAAGGSEAWRGRALGEVLRQMQAQGLPIVFSSAVVGPELRVEREPSASDPRARLDEVLLPLGLEARDGPGGSILILRARPAAGSLRGRVSSAADRRPIPGAAIRLDGAPAAAFSDALGRFEVAGVRPGSRDVRIEAAAHTSVELPRVAVRSGQTAVLRVELEPLVRFVTELVVTPGQHSVLVEEPAARQASSRDQALLAPAAGGDLSRTIQLLPGVAKADNTAAFHARGGALRDVALVLDGLELYDPFHLRSFHSPFSAIDGNVVERFEFLGGGFTAERGDRHGGFVDISTLRPGAAAQGALEAGTLNSRASYVSAGAPGAPCVLLSARVWYPEALIHATELGSGEKIDPRFADLYARADFELAARHHIGLHGLGVHDRLRYQERGEEVNESVDAATRNGYLWLRARSAWSEDVVTDTLVAAGRIRRDRRGLSTAGVVARVDDERSVSFLALQHQGSYQVGERMLLRGGFELRDLSSEYRYARTPPGAAGATTRLDLDALAVGLNAAGRLRLGGRLAAELGLRWDRQGWTRQSQTSPRLNLVWRSWAGAELRLALGRFAQSQRLHELQIEDGETTFAPAERARGAELSFQHKLGRAGHLRIDAYERRIAQVQPRWENLFEPLELFPETTTDRRRVAPERARLRGLELLLRGEDARPFVWWLSYALAAAEDRIEGAWVPRGWDQRHTGKLLLGYRRDERFTIALHATAHSGWPTTPASARAVPGPDGTTRFEALPGRRHSTRFAPYLRLDLKASGALRLPRGRLRLTVELQNLTDRNNPRGVNEFHFEPQPGGGAEARPSLDHWRGLTPSFSLRWEL